MWLQYVYSSQFGLLKTVFTKLHLTKLAAIPWTDGDHKFMSLLIAYCFGMVGYHMLIYVTGIIAIPLDIIEAAKIDGANVWQLALRVITPNMKPVLRVSLVLIMTSSFKSFDSIYVMTGGGPAHKTEVMASYMYNKAFLNLKYGYGCAVGLMLFVMCLVVSLAIQKILADR